MAREQVRFEALKEHRGWYFVEYSPPLTGYRFSTIQLTCVEAQDNVAVARAMETEARTWLHRYPIPVMVTAFSAENDVVSLDGARGCNHLIAWEQYPHVEPILEWRLVSNEELPDIALDRDFVETLFDSVPHKSRAEMEEEANRHAQSMRIGRWLVFVWAVVVPAGVALLEWWSDLLGLVVVIYALLKAGVIGLRLTGRLPKSDAERRREAEELQMRHHHYHCKRNPKGFARLKADNFRRWEIERTLAEAHELKASAPPRSVDG